MHNNDDKLTVLVVDDDIQIINLVTTFLNQEGFNVLSSQSMVQCLKIVESLEPDIILLDVILKSSDGFQILRTIRGVPLTKNLPIIIMTSLSEEDALTKAADSGASDFMKKPFELDELKNVIVRQFFPPKLSLLKKILVKGNLKKFKTHPLSLKNWFSYSLEIENEMFFINSKTEISEIVGLQRKELKNSLRIFIKNEETFFMIWPFIENPAANALFRINIKMALLERKTLAT